MHEPRRRKEKKYVPGPPEGPPKSGGKMKKPQNKRTDGGKPFVPAVIQNGNRLGLGNGDPGRIPDRFPHGAPDRSRNEIPDRTANINFVPKI